MSNRRRPVVPPCPDCRAVLVLTGPRTGYLAHDETCPSWRARTAEIRAAVGEDVRIVAYRWVWP